MPYIYAGQYLLLLPPKFGKGIFQIIKAFEFYLKLTHFFLHSYGANQIKIHALKWIRGMKSSWIRIRIRSGDLSGSGFGQMYMVNIYSIYLR